MIAIFGALGTLVIGLGMQVAMTSRLSEDYRLTEVNLRDSGDFRAQGLKADDSEAIQKVF